MIFKTNALWIFALIAQAIFVAPDCRADFLVKANAEDQFVIYAFRPQAPGKKGPYVASWCTANYQKCVPDPNVSASLTDFDLQASPHKMERDGRVSQYLNLGVATAATAATIASTFIMTPEKGLTETIWGSAFKFLSASEKKEAAALEKDVAKDVAKHDTKSVAQKVLNYLKANQGKIENRIIITGGAAAIASVPVMNEVQTFTDIDGAGDTSPAILKLRAEKYLNPQGIYGCLVVPNMGMAQFSQLIEGLLKQFPNALPDPNAPKSGS